MVEINITNNIKLSNLPTQLLKDIKQRLTITNPEYEKKIRMGFFIGKTPKKLNLYTTEGNDIIIPYGLKQPILDTLDKKGIKYQVNEKHAINELKIALNETIALRDYQKLAVSEILKHDNGILISPAGSGKTLMALSMIKDRPYKTLWITHTHELLMQSYRTAKRLYNNSLGKITEGKVDIQDITFATIQTLAKLDLSLYKDTFTQIIVDECHRATGTPTKLKQFYTVVNSLNAKYKYGVTATLFEKENEMSITPIYLIGKKLHEVKIENVKRVTATHEVVVLDTPTSSEYLKPDRTLDYAKMVDYIVYNGDRNERVVSELVKYYNNYNIVLSIRNDHLDIIQFMLQELGYSSHKLTGAESKKVRQQVLSDYEQGKIHYLLSNYQLSKEGLDLPIADTLHMVFPIGDKTTLIQSAGRVERLYNGKVSSRVVDYYDYNIPYMQRIYKQRLKILREIK